MKTEIENLAGETPGIAYELVVHRLAGLDSSAPDAYIQSALHADERPGPAALHYLIPELVKAEAEGRLLGSVTLVPQANPVGAAQHLFSQHMGRFSSGNRTNFNRDFPIPDERGVRTLDQPSSAVFADRRLKSRLLELADNHPIVLDLHCDDEGVQYLYVPEPLWPEMSDLAACLDAQAAVLWSVGKRHSRKCAPGQATATSQGFAPPRSNFVASLMSTLFWRARTRRGCTGFW